MSASSTPLFPPASVLPGWFNSGSGKALIFDEVAALKTLVPDQFYRVGLQFGLNEQTLMSSMNVEQAIYCDSGFSQGLSPNSNVLALPEALPLADSSVDLALMLHTLDYCEDPHRVLREVSQALSPEGVLVLTGFHPYSLWGAKRRLSKKQSPFDARFISRNVIQDRLELLGFRPLTGCMVNYLLPQMNTQWRSRLEWMNKMGDRWWPTLGAVYVLVVQKKIYSGLGVRNTKKQGKRWFPELKPVQAKVAQFQRLKNPQGCNQNTAIER
jgi:SAM-dependent methyltransferase